MANFDMMEIQNKRRKLCTEIEIDFVILRDSYVKAWNFLDISSMMFSTNNKKS